MSMEPFDYLTYKRNKQQNQTKVNKIANGNKVGAVAICVITFAVCFISVLLVIGSKNSKVDIEYGRFGNNSAPAVDYRRYESGDENEDDDSFESFTIDRRLFLIQQEENGPSKSRIVEKDNVQSEVISKEDFEQFKINNDEVMQKNQQTSPVQEQPSSEEQKPATTSSDNKIAMKPKLPTKPTVQQVGAINVNSGPTKVLVGKYSSLDEAKEMAGAIAKNAETTPFVKKFNNYYSVQIGAYENFDVAKKVAGKYRASGYEAWILE